MKAELSAVSALRRDQPKGAAVSSSHEGLIIAREVADRPGTLSVGQVGLKRGGGILFKWVYSVACEKGAVSGEGGHAAATASPRSGKPCTRLVCIQQNRNESEAIV